MKQYLDLLREIIETGRQRGDRTGTGTISIFDAKLKYDLSTGEFPLLTTKFVPRKAAWFEYKAMLNGELHLDTMVENNVKFWDPWRLEADVVKEVPLENYERLKWLEENNKEAHIEFYSKGISIQPVEDGHRWLDEKGVPRTRQVTVNKAGDLNAPYGSAWRNFSENPLEKKGVDQIAYALDLLRNNPESRRILISAWNPLWMPEETKEVTLSSDEMWEHLKTHSPDLYAIFWPRLEYHGKTDNCEEFLASHGVPRTKTVKVTPQENIVEGKPCLTPCHFLVEFYVEEMTLNERLKWCRNNANPYFQDLWEDHMSDYYSEEHCDQPKMSPERKAEWLTENHVPTQWLSLKYSMRSCDTMTGEPFNQVFYAFMLLSFAHELGMAPNKLVGNLTNVHIYNNQLEEAKLQLTREPYKPVECYVRSEHYYNSEMPKKGLFELTYEDFVFTEYKHHPAIKLQVSV